MQTVAVSGADHPQGVYVQAEWLKKVNLADYQNHVPLLRELAVVNDGPDGLEELELALDAQPGFFTPRTWLIDALPAGDRRPIEDLDLKLNGAELTRLTEAEHATLRLTLRRRGAEQALHQQAFAIELLPRNHWGGLQHLPEMVAAFVQPNDPVIDGLLKQAAIRLHARGLDAALDGYRGGARHAWEIAEALWGVVAALGLHYSLPPASFEHTGQKVRSPSQIVATRIATCLDLTLLFDALLEQAGLHPLVVFTQGHALAGVWLKDEMFSAPVVDDITALRKRMHLKELVLFETTLITDQSIPSFRRAVDQGATRVEQDEAFELAVDIRRARLQGIKPLASAEISEPLAPGMAEEAAEPPFEGPPELPDEEEGAATAPAEQDRLTRWQRRLLDLSLRNSLLNFRGGKRSVALKVPEPGLLEDRLAQDKAIKLLSLHKLKQANDQRDRRLHERRTHEDPERAFLLKALESDEVYAELPEEELAARLVELYRTTRTLMEEGGANTLYLALGFLVWTRQDKPDQRFRAPLVLLPVKLARRSVRSGFYLSLHEDEARLNPTLVQMLRQDFRLELGLTEGELPRDDSGLDLLGIWHRVEQAIKDIPGWEVSREVVLANFSFAKYLMWKDLTDRVQQLRDNPVVRHLLDHPREPYRPEVEFPASTQLDREYSPDQVFCPLPYDSSQLAAVLAAARGMDFVLIGPPGTGKSQTITNLIAHCLAEGKRVLFVAEKRAALEVVYRRLREIGLAEFCLELHSNKANKRAVLDQLGHAWDARGERDVQAWQDTAQKLGTMRAQLNDYVERMHRPHANGLSVYTAIGRVIEGQDLPQVELAFADPNAHTQEDLERLQQAAQALTVHAESIGWDLIGRHPLTGIEQQEWTTAWQSRLEQSAQDLQAKAQALLKAAAALCQQAQWPLPLLHQRARTALAALAQALREVRGRDWRFLLQPTAQATLARLHAARALLERHAALNAALSPPWPEPVRRQVEAGLKLLWVRSQWLAKVGRPWSTQTQRTLKQGLQRLREIARLQAQLSARYDEARIERLDLQRMLAAWERAQRSSWPVSWLLKRKLRKDLLKATVEAPAKLDVGSELQLWAEIRHLRTEVHALNPGPEAQDLWAGVHTSPALVESALALQSAVARALQGQAWEEKGLEAVAAGQCGPLLAERLQALRALRQTEATLERLDPLREATGGLWRGRDTSPEVLQAALLFQEDWSRVAQRGELSGEHPTVANGACGADLTEAYRLLSERADLERQLSGYADLTPATAGLWQGLDTPVDLLTRAERLHHWLTSAWSELGLDQAQLQALRVALERLLAGNEALLAPVAQAAASYIVAHHAFEPALEALLSTMHAGEKHRTAFAAETAEVILQRCAAILQHRSKLSRWCAWRHACSEAQALGLGPLVQAIEQGRVAPSQVLPVFHTAYARWWLNAVVDSDPVLRRFVSAQHERRIADFRELDKKYLDCTRQYIRARLCAQIPARTAVQLDAEWGVLRHELSKRARHMALRQLLQRIPTALMRLTPCLLMSPLSVAQYLPANANHFDLVVFDEASQIPVWDALGAMARGRQVVMVGDPKQLPPTRFFERTEHDWDDEDVEEDLESVLDECLGAGLPIRKLDWHYRSRHESLIAFSNHRYYNDGLVTFPSPHTEDQAVSLHYVKEGRYAKGGARTNVAEAKALVADVVATLKSPEFRQARLSLGVVTFNSEQQRLIEDLLDQARRDDPALEAAFAEELVEPVFVKNLENVQGDERDIIYFSTTYGPDIHGHVSLNFGPLNRMGGERRLNVAITRARLALRVFTSLKPEHIDLARTQAAGVRDLRLFLEYAEQGLRAFARVPLGSRGGYDSPFEAAVAEALTRHGWRVHSQVGASKFRIDLAVVHPDAPGRYLCGIECDGATYHRHATARDRDLLREQVLRALGWQIVRIWSHDWWTDPKGTAERLHERLDALLHACRQPTCAGPSPAVQGGEGSAGSQAVEGLPATAEGVNPQTPETTPIHAAWPRSSAAAPVDPQEQADGPMAATDLQSDLAEVEQVVDAKTFFDRRYEPNLARLITHVVEAEGPISGEMLARRIARAHGWKRTGKNIRQWVEEVAAKHHPTTREDVGVFYWPKGLNPDAPLRCRRPAKGKQREPKDVCLQELTALAREAIAAGHQGVAALDYMRRALGLERLRDVSRGRLQLALHEALRSS
ncbi:MAG: DUF3320 domain-containing protein [Burkholderiales bacterium]|nr:DUF3320 domain-containing protein [Burkholderiales bacterium]